MRVDWEQKDPNRIRPMSWDRRKYVRTKTELLRGQCIAASKSSLIHYRPWSHYSLS